MRLRPDGKDISVRARAAEALWAFGFLLVLAGMLAPILIWSQAVGREVSIAEQAGLILVATWLCQRLRKRPLAQVVGRPGARWARQLLTGTALGALMLLAPAALLAISGSVSWTVQPAGAGLILSAALAMLAVAIAEELLFRGFLFQRLVGAIGPWPAQLAVAGLFLLTHFGNPGMEGWTRLIAGANIFAASLLLGLVFLKTRSLAMPIGIHWAANLVQGPLLGLGVSGNATSALLAPILEPGRAWWTGGSFGLEASVPGLAGVIAVLLLAMLAGSGAERYQNHCKDWEDRCANM